jgi:TRAP-type C4-dicarboxylate transport system substrate-binding protein
MLKKKLFQGVIGFCLVTMAGMLFLAPAFGKAIEITVSTNNPEMSPPAKAMTNWAKTINEACGGKVNVTVHYGGALLSMKEAYRGIQKGTVDAAHYVLDRRDGFLLNTVVTLPFMGWPGQVELGRLYEQLMAKFPEMRNEWKGVVPYVFGMMPPTHIHNVKKPIRTPADLQGMKFHGAEYALVQAISQAGGTAVQLDIADMFMSLDRGLLDGVINHFPVLFVFGVLEILDHHTIFGDGGINMTPIGIIWNERSWKKLPKEIQDKIMGLKSAFLEPFYAMDLGFQGKTMGDAKNFGHDFVYLTPEEIKVWYDLVKGPIHDKWIKDAESKGLPGKAVYNAVLEMIK